MIKKRFARSCALGLVVLAIPAMVFAETVGLFFDSSVEQIKFAAGDVKAAIESKGFTVEVKPLSELSASYANKKVVIAMASNTTVTGIMGGTAPTGLVEQGYALRTTTTPQTSYWVLGGENLTGGDPVYKANGAMYGGFQLAENIMVSGFGANYTMEEKPYIKERGAKFNVPMDGRSPTYSGHFDGESFSRALLNVYDINFWKEWFDAKARNRYNMFSMWTDHPFTAMVKVAGYDDCWLTDVQDPSGKVIKTMSINQKIEHWKQVIDYAHARGFRFYIVTWNTYTHGATGKHGITDASNNASTVTYMAASMRELLQTYPSLDGFGCTAGEHMTGDNTLKEAFLWSSYGKPMLELAKANPERKFTFIHRFHYTTPGDITAAFSALINQPNVNFNTSIKYSQAKMLSTAVPKLMTGDFGKVKSNNLKTYLTVRNDDLYFLDWGDPVFAKSYIKGFYEGNTADLKYITGFYIGSDGWCPTRTWHVKDASRQNELEIKRLWFFDMVWGRISYNPDVSDDVFKAGIKMHYPQADESKLYDAWCNVSKAFQVSNECVVGTMYFDFMYMPETQNSNSGYVTASKFKTSNIAPPRGTTLASPIVAADSAKKCAEAALAILNTMGGNNELRDKIINLQTLACLSLYVSEKVRFAKTTGATATAALGKAYCYWVNYAKLMDETYAGQAYQRVDPLTPNWSSYNSKVLKDFNDAGGSGTPACQLFTVPPSTRSLSVPVVKKQSVGIQALSSRAITLYLPGEQGFSAEIYKSNGVTVAKLSKSRNTRGVSRFALGKKLPQGIYLVRVKSPGQVMVKQMSVVRN